MNPSAGTLRTCFIQKDMCKFIGQQTFPGCICTWTRIRCSQCSDTCLYEIFSWCDSSVRWACAPCSHVESEQLKITHQHLHIHQSFPSQFNLGIFSFSLRSPGRKSENDDEAALDWSDVLAADTKIKIKLLASTFLQKIFTRSRENQ